MKECLSYNDVLLLPQYSSIKSRSEVNLESRLGNKSYTLPIISSPMDTVTGGTMAHTMSDQGGQGVIHRYTTIDEQVAVLRNVTGLKAAAIGVTGDFEKRARALYDSAGVNILCLDVAHGHHVLMERALKTI